MNDSKTELSRAQIRRVLKRHYGSIKALATELEITGPAISLWLRGRTTSARVAAAARAKAITLLAAESTGDGDGGTNHVQ